VLFSSFHPNEFHFDRATVLLHRGDFRLQLLDERPEFLDLFRIVPLFVFPEEEQIGDVLRPPAVEIEFRNLIIFSTVWPICGTEGRVLREALLKQKERRKRSHARTSFSSFLLFKKRYWLRDSPFTCLPIWPHWNAPHPPFGHPLPKGQRCEAFL
jgi:hypothetical protein